MESLRKVERRAKQGGFTLVELLLVIAILGVLAGVGMMNIQGFGNDARINATRAKISTVEQAVRTYEIKTAKYPDSLDQLTQPIGESPALLKKADIEDSWGIKFNYSKSAKGYEIRSAGPDSQMNTADDLTNATE